MGCHFQKWNLFLHTSESYLLDCASFPSTTLPLFFLLLIHFEGHCWPLLTDDSKYRFHTKPRTRLTRLWCKTDTGGCHRRTESNMHRFGEVMAAWLRLCLLMQVCVLWNRKRWVTFEPSKDGCRHPPCTTLPHLQESNAGVWMSRLSYIHSLYHVI